jgi:hypothetical protein
MPSPALWATLAPVPSERVVPRFRYQYLRLVLPRYKNEKRVKLFPPDSLQWTSSLVLALCRPLPGCGLSGDAFWRGMPRTARSGFPPSRLPNGCGTPCGAPQDPGNSMAVTISLGAWRQQQVSEVAVGSQDEYGTPHLTQLSLYRGCRFDLD